MYNATKSVQCPIAHHQQGWQQQQPYSQQDSLIWMTHKTGRALQHLFCPVHSGWQREESRWWRREHPCKGRREKNMTIKMLITVSFKVSMDVLNSTNELPDLVYLRSVAPRPLYRPGMPFSLSSCLVSCMAVGDLASTVPAATVSGISFLWAAKEGYQEIRDTINTSTTETQQDSWFLENRRRLKLIGGSDIVQWLDKTVHKWQIPYLAKV